MRKRALCLLLALVILTGCIPAVSIPAQAAGNGVAQRISQLRSKFPNGRYWNHRVDSWDQTGDHMMSVGNNFFGDSVSQTPCWTHNGVPNAGEGKYDCNHFDGGIQCWGFANKIFYDIFGVYRSGVGKMYDITNITVGDYVRFGSDGDGHSAVVINRVGDTLTLVEGNFQNNCMIKWDRQVNLYSGDNGRAIAYFCHAPNYDAINGSSPAPQPSTLTLDKPTLIYADNNNAQIESYIRNGGSPVYCSKFGVKVWEKATGKLVVDHPEDIPSNVQGGQHLQIWVNITRELNITLKSGTEYEYQFFAYTGSGTINSEKSTFKTTGPTPAPFSYTVTDIVPKKVTQTGAVLTCNLNFTNASNMTDAQKRDFAKLKIIVNQVMSGNKYERAAEFDVDFPSSQYTDGKHALSVDLSKYGVTLKPDQEYRIWWYFNYAETVKAFTFYTPPEGADSRITLSYPGVEFVKDTNASVYTLLQNGGAAVDTGNYAFQLWEKATGNRLVNYNGTINSTLQQIVSVKLSLDMTEELGMTLKPGTEYECQFSATRNGKTYYSEKRAFKTTGTASPSPSPAPGELSITGVEVQDGVYNGSTQKGYSGTPTAAGYSGAIAVKYTGRGTTSYESTTAPKNAGSYTVTFTADDGKSYGELSLDFIIAKAGVTVRADDKNVPIHGTMPKLTCTVAGLAPGEKLLTEPKVACTTEPDLDVAATYVISASGAKVPSGGNYEEKITYIDGILNVYTGDEPGPAEATGLRLDMSELYLTPGSSAVLMADVEPDGASAGRYIWYSDDPNVATVSSTGRVTAVKEGRIAVRVTTGKLTASCVVIVGPWYQKAVDFVQRKGIMNGYDNGDFGPSDRLTRAMLAQILYNNEKRPYVKPGSKFSDVSSSAWYSSAVNWAAERGIVKGSGDRFNPDDSIARQDLAVMLWRYAGEPTDTISLSGYSDWYKTSDYAQAAMRWAVKNNIVKGSGGKLEPRDYATRAEVAQMLMNYFSK